MALRFLNSGYFAGKVGIGIAAPTKTLNVEFNSSSVAVNTGEGLGGGTAGTGVLLRNSNTTVGTFANLDFRANNVDARIAVTYNATNNGDFHFILDNTTANPLTRLFIEGQTGNVGIGTTDPDQKLQIEFANTDTSFSGGSGGDWGGEGIRIENTSNTVDTMAILHLRNNDADVHIASIRQGSNDSDLGFFFEGDEKVRFTNEGNVGIGTTSPDTKLDIEDSNPFVTIQGSSSSYVNAGVQFISNHASTARALGNFYYSAHSDVEWFSGLPYNDNDAFVINRNASYTVPSSQSSPPGIGASAGTLLKVSSTGAIQFNNYSGTNETGTPTYLLGTDALGNIVKTNTVPGSAAGPYLPLAGGTITGNLTVNGTTSIGNQLTFPYGSMGDYIYHTGDGNTFFGFNSSDQWKVAAGGNVGIQLQNTGVYLYYGGNEKIRTTSGGVTITGDIKIDSALLSNQENTDIDTGAEVVAQVAHATYTAAFFDFVVKKGTNLRSGTVYACHNGDTTPLVEFTETSTNDLGDTSDVTLSVDISGANMRLLATVTSDDWSVKSLIRAI